MSPGEFQFRITLAALGAGAALSACSNGEKVAMFPSGESSEVADEQDAGNGGTETGTGLGVDEPAWVNGSYLTCAWQAVETDTEVSFTCRLYAADGKVVSQAEVSGVEWSAESAAGGSPVLTMIDDAASGLAVRVIVDAARALDAQVVAAVNPGGVSRVLARYPVVLPGLDKDGPLSVCLKDPPVDLPACFSANGIVIPDQRPVQASFALADADLVAPAADGVVPYTLKLVKPADVDASIDWALGEDGGGASAGVDFTVATGTAQIKAGAVEAVIEIPLIGTDVRRGDRSLALNFSNAVGGPLPSPATVKLVIKDSPTSRLLVTAVRVGGSGWPVGATDVAVPTGASNQLRTLPFYGIDRIKVRYSGPAPAVPGIGPTLAGVNVASYAIASSTYDDVRREWTHTLSAPILDDKLRLTIPAAAHTGLDGDFTNSPDFASPGGSLPSGDGSGGGAFSFRFNVLRANGKNDSAADNGVISPIDSLVVINAINAAAPYNRWYDFNNDGLVNANDANLTITRLNDGADPKNLPVADP